MEAGAMSEMQPIPLERKITWGGILTILTIFATAGMNWGISTSQAEQTQAEVSAIKSDVQALKDARYSDNGRMVRVETLLEEILKEIRASR